MKKLVMAKLEKIYTVLGHSLNISAFLLTLKYITGHKSQIFYTEESELFGSFFNFVIISILDWDITQKRLL